MQLSRKPDIMADAAYEILCRDPKTSTGNFYIDDDVLKSVGITDLKQYACYPEMADQLMPDFFLDVSPEDLAKFSTAETKNPYSSPRSESGDGEIPKLFQKIETLLTEELVKKVGAIYQFNVKGNEAGTWHLDLKAGAGKCGQGEPPSSPDATLTMDSKHFADMFMGKLKPANAFMTGKLKISGDLQKAMKLEKLMGSMKSKL